jgi:3-oxoacyl-(acyl-carrier-protein) synthase
MMAIRDGVADTMYAGGVGSSIHPQMMMVRATRKMNADPNAEPGEAARPFDQGATGIVPGEAGGMLALERESSATARGATIRAELAGYGEWFVPPTEPRGLPASPAGIVFSIRRALQMAGAEAADVDVVFAHGESRSDLDRLEALGLAEALGPRAGDVPVISTTAHLGALEAAAGPVAAALAVRVLQTGEVPGALNREAPLPEYKGPISTRATHLDAKLALVAITTREGVNAALVLRKV